MQIGFFLSPIVYPLSTVPPEYLKYYMLNPMTVLMQMYRDVLLYHQPPALEDSAFALAAGLVIMTAAPLSSRG